MNFLNLPNHLVVNTTIGHGYTWGDAANLAISGFAIVFLMLILLVLVIKIFGFIMESITNKKDNNSNGDSGSSKNDKAKATQKQQPQADASAAASVQNDELIAVIAAAVNAMYEGSGIKPRISRICESGTRAQRSPWATLGLIENTRAF